MIGCKLFLAAQNSYRAGVKLGGGGIVGGIILSKHNDNAAKYFV